MVSHPQVSENAKQDLKDGLALYNSDTNLGLRNAWNIIQAEVGDSFNAAFNDDGTLLANVAKSKLAAEMHFSLLPTSSEAERLIKIQKGRALSKCSRTTQKR